MHWKMTSKLGLVDFGPLLAPLMIIDTSKPVPVTLEPSSSNTTQHQGPTPVVVECMNKIPRSKKSETNVSYTMRHRSQPSDKKKEAVCDTTSTTTTTTSVRKKETSLINTTTTTICADDACKPKQKKIKSKPIKRKTNPQQIPVNTITKYFYQVTQVFQDFRDGRGNLGFN